MVPPPTPKSSHIMCQSVFIPPENKLGYFSRFFICFLPQEVQGSATQVSLIVNLLTEKKPGLFLKEKLACSLIPLRIWIIKAESSEVFVHDAQTRPFLSTEQLPFPSFFSVILQDL